MSFEADFVNMFPGGTGKPDRKSPVPSDSDYKGGLRAMRRNGKGVRLRRAAAALFAAALTLLSGGCAGQRSVTVGVEAGNAPLASRGSDGAAQGFLVELTSDIAQRMGVSARFSFVSLPQSGAAAAQLLNRRQVDAVWTTAAAQNATAVSSAAGAFADAGASADALFTRTVLRDNVALAVNAASDIQQKSDLSGRAAGALKGSGAFRALASAGLSLKGGAPAQYSSTAEAFLALDGGSVDALAVQESEARNRMTEHAGQYRLLPGSLGSQSYCLAVRRNDSRLRDRIEQALSSLRADGTTAALSKKWFDSDMTSS